LLSDTVGFIKKLPHHLIEAFNATLQEAMTADFLLHLVDITSENVEDNLSAVQSVLEKINADEISNIVIFNKTDLMQEKNNSKLQILQTLYPDSIAISAKTGEGVEELKNKIILEMRKTWLPAKLTINASNGKLISIIKDETEILEEKYSDGHAYFEIFFDPRIIRKLTDAKNDDDIIDFEQPQFRKSEDNPDFFVPP